MRRLWPYAVIAILSGCEQEPEVPAGASFDLARGKALYEQHCVLCHGDDGNGGPLSAALVDIVPFAFEEDQAPAELVEVILQGQGSMQGWQGIVTSDEATDIAGYILQLPGQAHSE